MSNDVTFPLEQKLTHGVTIQDFVAGNGKHKAQKNSKINFFFECRLDTGNDVVMSSGQKQYVIILGSKDNLLGWNIGLKNVFGGTKRRVVCPPKTAYGDFGYPPMIPANATLVYDFEIISVEPPSKK